MITIREIDHIVSRVVDLHAMLRFYAQVLGCTIERRQHEIGLVQLRAGRSLVDLVSIDGKLGRIGGAARPFGKSDPFVFEAGPHPTIWMSGQFERLKNAVTHTDGCHFEAIEHL